MALTSDGVVIAGTSANTVGDLDYLVIKYNSNGDQLWTQRYDRAGAQDTLRDLAVDEADNVFITGTSDTVKYSAAGNFIWKQPFGGRAIVANTNFVYVTGFSDVDFATAQFTNNNTDGGVGWVRKFNGPANDIDISAKICMASNGDVVVAGWITYAFTTRNTPIDQFCVIRYGVDGVQAWQTTAMQSNAFGRQEAIASLLIDSGNSVYVLGSLDQGFQLLLRFRADGNLGAAADWTGAGGAYAMKFSGDQNVVCVGRPNAITTKFSGTFTPTNAELWTQYYPSPNSGDSGATCVDIGGNGDVFTAGYAPRTPQDNDIFVLRLGPDGAKRFSVTYDSPQHGSDYANAIVVDHSGNVYVTGFSTTPEGGTEFITIKYSSRAKIQANPDGTVHLEFPSEPGQQYVIEATTNFLNWQSLLTNTVDASGLVQFNDTNASSIPYRFYRGKTIQ